LIDDVDRSWFKNIIGETIKSEFKLEITKIYGGDDINSIYGNFGDTKSTAKPYVELGDRDVLQKTMESYLEDFNAMTNTPMSLVLFESAVEHIARISRIINQPYGNALLVGVGGSGRKSLTAMAVHIAEFNMFTIEITKSYSLLDWREDIKIMMNKAGIENKPTVFLIDDTQIVTESFLEDINGMYMYIYINMYVYIFFM
jgi:dynein heavy chain